MRRFAEKLATSTVLLTFVAAGAAQAQVAQSIQADLLNPASDVPGAQVTVTAPSGDQTLVGTGEAVNVTMAVPFGTALAGIQVPAGAQPLYSTTSPRLVAWDLAVVEAIKHAIIAGSQFGSISIPRNYPGVAPMGYPDLIFAPPGYQPLAQVPTTMSLETIRTKIQRTLPSWAQHGTVRVANDAVGERVVSVKAELPIDAFRVIPVGGLLHGLVGQQISLAPDGANIGRVLVELENPVNGDPLYAAGADVSVSYWSDWYSPLVAPLRFDLPSAMGVLQTPLDAAYEAGAPPPPTEPLGSLP